MRYAIISDIHSNRQAFKAVLTDAASLSVDEIICLGDLVGYGPSPVETVELAYSKVNHFILGNHDAVVCGRLSPDNFNDNAKRLIEWTASAVPPAAVKFFKEMPLLLSGKFFICSHGEFSNPGRYGYIIDEGEAVEAFNSSKEPLLFVGHSHYPSIFVQKDPRSAKILSPQDFAMERDKRYIVNVGSVGQARDGDIRASYCILDADRKEIFFRKVPFDIDAYCDDMRKAGLPEETSYFVGIYRQKAPKNIREILEFERLGEKDAVRTASELKNLEKNIRTLRKTRQILASLLIFCLIAVAFSSWLFIEQGKKTRKTEEKLAKAKEEAAKNSKTLIASTTQSKTPQNTPLKLGELIEMPSPRGRVDKSSPMNFWSLELGDNDSQAVFVESFKETKESKAPPFIAIKLLSKSAASESAIISDPVSVFQGERFTASFQFKALSAAPGAWIGVFLEEETENGTRIPIGHNVKNSIAQGNSWTPVSFTMPKEKSLASSGKLRMLIKAQFAGEILVRKCSLERKDK